MAHSLLHRIVDNMEYLGRIWRSHFGAGDREEMPFNRSQQDVVRNLAAKESSITAFGSTNNTHLAGTPLFVNAQFPPMDEAHAKPLVIGPYCAHPYTAASFFNVSAMSYGALSRNATTAFSKGAKIAGCWVNTGEGGLADAHLSGGADIIFQIGTAKYGVRNPDGTLNEDRLRDVAAHPEVKMIEIKLAQGAKPGKGGILPGAKVSDEIAHIRHIPAGQDSVSPSRHVDIANNDELLDAIHRIRTMTGKPVGFKTVVSDEGSLDDLCEKIKTRGIESAPDFITVDGGDGGTGAAPTVLMDSVGLPLREALPMLTQVLIRHGLKDRIRTIASGKLIVPERVALALAMGADFVNSARGPMFSIGCIQAKRCDSNTCPTGITTSDPHLQKRLDPETAAVKLANYNMGLRHGVELIARSCGLDDPRALRPHHVRIVQPNGQTILMSDMYPGLTF